jgi:tetratricopeptide (TPR) repeat protein
MQSPSGFGLAHRAFRLGLIGVLGCFLTTWAHARESAQPTLADAFLAVDAQFLDAAQISAARVEFDALVRAASSCGSSETPRQDRARCVVDSLFASEELVAVAEPSNPESSTVTSALVNHRGNCAALTALVLAVAERVDVSMDAVVFPRHVVVRGRGNDDQVFELLSRGSPSSMSQLRRRLGADDAHNTRVRPSAFLAYYVDNLVVRFADAGQTDRAESMFEKAIDAGPRVARIRFNYGTFLLGSDRLERAETQLRRAVRLDSRNAPARANLGVTLARLGETFDARRCFERAIREEPANRIAAENLKALGRDGPPPPR